LRHDQVDHDISEPARGGINDREARIAADLVCIRRPSFKPVEARHLSTSLFSNLAEDAAQLRAVGPRTARRLLRHF
jgi:hypothetical protein